MLISKDLPGLRHKKSRVDSVSRVARSIAFWAEGGGWGGGGRAAP